MGQIVDLTVPNADVEMLRAGLSPKDFSRAMFNVVGRTLSKLVTAIKREVKSENPLIKKKYLDRAIKLLKPKGDPPIGAVTVNNKEIPLIGFKVSGFTETGGRGHGGKVTIAKDLPPIVLKHGFIATVKAVSKDGDVSEHDGIFLRGRIGMGPTTSGAVLSTSRGKRGELRKYTAMGFAERLPIKQAFGPGILKIVEIPDVLGRVQFDAAAEMHKQALSQLSRFGSPSAPAAEPSPAD